jgi:hypothetical protein
MQHAFGRFIDSQIDTSTEPINIQTRKEEHRLVTDNLNTDGTPLIKFARFRNSTLELFRARTDSGVYRLLSRLGEVELASYPRNTIRCESITRKG